MPAAINTMPATIPATAEVPPTFPATNMEVGPSAPPMTDTDICPFAFKIKPVITVAIPITVIPIPKSFFMRFIPPNSDCDLMIFKENISCYILLLNSPLTLENTKFIAGELSLKVSLVLYLLAGHYEP